MRRTLRTGLVAGLMLLACAAPALAGKRVAFVVGINDYPAMPAERQLGKAVNDARAIAASFAGLGYEVATVEGASYDTFYTGWGRFKATIRPGDEVAFFFSGHGVEIKGQNFLIPSDSGLPEDGNAELFKRKLINLGELMEELRSLEERPRASLFIIDACRDNPFVSADGKKSIGGTRGLKLVRPPEGTFILFSARSGEEALDGLPGDPPEASSVFTRKLLPLLATPGLKVQDVAVKVRTEVSRLAREARGHTQNPAYDDQLSGDSGDWCLAGCEAAGDATDGGNTGTQATAPVATAEPETPGGGILDSIFGTSRPSKTEPAAPISEEARVWPTIESTKSCGILDDFVRRFDSGGSIYVDFARSRRKELRCGESEVVVVVPAAESCSGTLARVGGKVHCLRPGDVFRDLAVGPAMVVVPAGTFSMGSPESEADRSSEEGPRHDVTIANAFAVGKFEVTFEQWDACVSGGGCNGYRPGARGRGRRPVNYVSWDDAKAYAAWLSRTSGKPYRLLSEAEWEYAARAGTTTLYSFGDVFSNAQANNDKGQTVAVGQYPANAFGLHDVHGNVWEWTEDCYADSYSGAPSDGSVAKESSACRRVLRGGSWSYDPRYLRSAIRSWITTDFRLNDLGFRLARTLTP